MKKVGLFVFNPFVNDSRVLKEAISLANNGYDVEVIAHMNKNLKVEEKKENFSIKRVSYLDRTTNISKIRKIKAYVTYIKESVRHCKDFDILHCNDLNTLPIGFVIKKFYNKQVQIVYDAHEYETEMIGQKGIAKKIAKIFENFFIKYVDKTITVSNSIANEYVKLYGIEKPALVLNTPPYKEINKKNIFRETFNLAPEQTIFLYQGGISHGRGIETIIDTFKKLKNNKIVIVFMGYGELEEYVKNEVTKNKNIYFHKAVTPDILLNYTCSADFGISMIEDSCLSYRYCLPNKIFEYIMAEVPVIVSNLPEMKKIVLDHKIGIVVEEDNVEGLTQAIKSALQLDKEEVRINLKKVKYIYNWEEQEKILLKIYDK
jgi:glycosyltransferase involved in cell wall biosynthesis